MHLGISIFFPSYSASLTFQDFFSCFLFWLISDRFIDARLPPESQLAEDRRDKMAGREPKQRRKNNAAGHTISNHVPLHQVGAHSHEWRGFLGQAEQPWHTWLKGVDEQISQTSRLLPNPWRKYCISHDIMQQALRKEAAYFGMGRKGRRQEREEEEEKRGGMTGRAIDTTILYLLTTII